MVGIKSATDARDFKSPSRHAKENILGMSIRWRNSEGGLKDKQMGDFILTMGLIPQTQSYQTLEFDRVTPQGISPVKALPAQEQKCV